MSPAIDPQGPCTTAEIHRDRMPPALPAGRDFPAATQAVRMIACAPALWRVPTAIAAVPLLPADDQSESRWGAVLPDRRTGPDSEPVEKPSARAIFQHVAGLLPPGWRSQATWPRPQSSFSPPSIPGRPVCPTMAWQCHPPNAAAPATVDYPQGLPAQSKRDHRLFPAAHPHDGPAESHSPASSVRDTPHNGPAATGE